MVKRLAVILILLLISCPLPAAAQEAVVVDLAEDHIDITTGFNGASLTLFGVKQGPGEIAVVIKGPEQDVTIRKKEKVAGAWMNRTWTNFSNVPVYYDYALSVPEPQLAEPDVLKANGIGVKSLEFKTQDWLEDKRKNEFREALIRTAQAKGLYANGSKKVTLVGSNFFRVDFYLPAKVHIGTYKIQTFYFEGGKVREIKINKLKVAHVGMSARIHRFATKNGFLYGLVCVLFAVFAGWLSHRIRRRS